jgi:hypothetical protein
MVKEEFDNVALGDTVSYHLRAADYPTNPFRLWRGRVTAIHRSNGTLQVSVLDTGYAGESEHISWDQVVTVERERT